MLEKWYNSLMVKVKLLYLILGFVLVSVISIGSFFAGRIYESTLSYRASNEIISPIPPMTGYDVWDAVNDYRVSKNLPKLKLSEELCDNIIERYDMIEKNQTHEGLDEFVQKQKNAGRYSPELELTELFTSGSAKQEVLKNWTDSPSHEQLLSDPRFEYGCSYAYNSLALLFLSEQAK